MKTKILILLLSAFFFGKSISAQNDTGSLGRLIKSAIAVNPKIKMLQSKFEVSKTKIK